MKLSVAAVFLIFISSIFAQWQGRWTDEAEDGGVGGSLYICESNSNSRAYGAYSEAGVLVGTISGNTFSGNWVEAGVGWQPCAHGTFFISLTNSDNSFSGTYTCDDDEEGKILY